VKRFRYTLDPLCLVACAAYVFGRWYLKRHAADGFWHNQFTDLLLIPAALPVFLWIQRQLGLRRHDARPTWREIGLHFAVWSVAAEWISPALLHTGTGDWRDVVAYGAGAVLAGGWWSLG
jgi:hypothetical protein